MTLKIFSLALYVLATGLFVTWLVLANGLGRDKSIEGKTADKARRRKMRMLMGLAFATLIAALGLPSLRMLLSSAL